MKLQSNEQLDDAMIVASGGIDEEETEFVFEPNAQAFRTLSQSLYKNIIGSIVRELACNAYDSHVAAGKADLPIEISLPTHINPLFTIEDFGVGLNDDEVKNIYTRFFKSTKTQSNDLVGAFGLGSKTPFAYASAFSVTAVKDGERRAYSVYFNERGRPSLRLMLQETTTDSNGVKIVLAVDRNDTYKFSEEVKRQLRFFPVKPRVTNEVIVFNDDLIGHNAQNVLLNTDNVIILRNECNEIRQITCVLGVVGYDLELHQLTGKLSAEELKFAELLRRRSVLKFNIGEIEVTASREGISYTPISINAIRAKLRIAREDVKRAIEDLLQDASTPWEQASFLNSYGSLAELFVRSGFTIPGTTILSASIYYGFDTTETINALNRTGKAIQVRVYNYDKPRSRDGRVLSRTVKVLEPRSNWEVFIRDTKTDPVLRLKAYIAAHPDKTLVVIEQSKIPLPYDASNDFKTALGGVEIHSLDKLPHIVKPPNRSQRTTPRHQIYKLDLHELQKISGLRLLSSNEGAPVHDPIDTLVPGIYVELKGSRFDATAIKGRLHNGAKTLAHLENLFRTEKRAFPEVYGVSKVLAKRLAKSPGWMHCNDFIEQELQRVLAYTPQIERCLVAKNLMDDICQHWLSKPLITALIYANDGKYFRRLNKSSPATYVVRYYRILQKRYVNTKLLERIDNFSFLFNEPVSPTNTKLTKAMERCWMLEAMRHKPTTDPRVLEHIVYYINFLGFVP
jgi:hypothetical protein